MTLVELQTAESALMAAIGSGVRRVQFADRSVEYHSLRDMNEALKTIRAEIEGYSSARSRTFVVSQVSGF